MFDDDVWDENRWESFLRKDDERVTRYMKLLHRFMAENPMPPAEDKSQRAQWDEAFRAFLSQHGWMRDEMELSSFFSDPDEVASESQEHFELMEDEEDVLDQEASFDRLERLQVYQSAYHLTRTVLKWSDKLPGAVKDSTLVQFCANIMQISANIAKGHGIGYERDMLGGNIACLKTWNYGCQCSARTAPRTKRSLLYGRRNVPRLIRTDLRSA